MSFNIEQVNSGYMSLSAAGLAEGTNSATFKTTATLAYTSNGVIKSKGATDNLTFSSGHTALGQYQACLFAVWINGAGDSVTTTQGPIVASGDPCPVPPAGAAGTTLVGLIKVTTGATTFTPGTTDLGAANVTDVYYDCSLMPGAAL